MVLSCPFCNHGVERGARKCGKCDLVIARFCPYCAEEISVTAEMCKYCGDQVEPQVAHRKPEKIREIDREAAQADKPEIVFVDDVQEIKPTPEIEFVEETNATIAWEDKKNGVFRGWWKTFKEANFDATFFKRMPTTGGKTKAINFVFASVIQMLFVAQLLALPFLTALALEGPVLPYSGLEYAVMVAVGALVGIPVLWLLVALSTLMNAGIYHLIIRMLGGKGSYEATTRVVAYSSSAQVWGLIPWLGGMISFVFATIMHIRGFQEVHKLSTARTVIAVFTPMILALVLVFVILGVAIASMGCGAC